MQRCSSRSVKRTEMKQHLFLRRFAVCFRRRMSVSGEDEVSSEAQFLGRRMYLGALTIAIALACFKYPIDSTHHCSSLELSCLLFLRFMRVQFSGQGSYDMVCRLQPVISASQTPISIHSTISSHHKRKSSSRRSPHTASLLAILNHRPHQSL